LGADFGARFVAEVRGGSLHEHSRVHRGDDDAAIRQRDAAKLAEERRESRRWDVLEDERREDAGVGVIREGKR